MNAVLRFGTVTVLLIASTMTLLLAVVCLLYVIYLDASPTMREEMPALLAATGLFGVLALLAGAAFWGLRRETAWRWAAQGLMWAAVVVSVFLMQRALLG